MNLSHDLRKAPTLLFAATLLTLTSVQAHAVSYLETFDNPINPAIWSLTSGGNDWVVSGGKLTITRVNGNNGSLEFVPEVIGDFEVQFDYVLNWTSTFAFGDRIQLSVSTNAPVHGYGVGHTQEGSIFGFSEDPGVTYAFGPNTPAGTLRITRTGSLVTTQYLNNGNWATLRTGTDSRDMTVRLDNYIFNSFVAGSSVEIDNFSISAQQFSAPVPEPETWAMLLAGLGLVGFAVRRRRLQ